jgi:hypothetical protein
MKTDPECSICNVVTTEETGCFRVRMHEKDASVNEVIMCRSCTETFIDLLKKENPRLPIERKS